MNKKNMILALNLLLFGTVSILPVQQLTFQEEQVRRDHVCRLSKANALGVAQYLEKGVFNPELIDRDIIILEKDSRQAMKNKSWAEGYFYSWMIPSCVKSIVIGSGLGALASGVATAIGSILTYNVWNSSSVVNFSDKIGYRVIDSAKYYEIRAQYLIQQSEYNKCILTGAVALPFVFVGTLALAGLAKYSSRKLSNYKNRNTAFIQEMQERFNLNSIVIAELQQIEYDATISK